MAVEKGENCTSNFYRILRFKADLGPRGTVEDLKCLECSKPQSQFYFYCHIKSLEQCIFSTRLFLFYLSSLPFDSFPFYLFLNDFAFTYWKQLYYDLLYDVLCQLYDVFKK